MKRAPLPLLLAAGFLIVFPFFLRRRPRVARRITIRANPRQVFALLEDLREWPRWTAWARREEIHFAYDGPSHGVGATQHWASRRMDGSLRITQSVPEERLAYTAAFAGGKYTMEGVVALEPVMMGTRVTWVCSWDAPHNPYRRYLDLVMMAMIGRDFSAGLENLKTLVEREATLG